MRISGDATRYGGEADDDYTQVGNLFRLFDQGQKERLFRNTAAAMQGVPMEIIQKQLEHFDRADPEYGAGVRRALGIGEVQEV